MSPLLIIAGMVLLVAALLGLAEWRWRERPLLRTPLPLEVHQAMRAIREHPETAHLPLRIAVELVPGEGLTVPEHTGETTVERAWTPWGSWRYLVRLDSRDPGPVYLHEVAAHIVEHDAGRGWNRDHTSDRARRLQDELARSAWGSQGRP